MCPCVWPCVYTHFTFSQCRSVSTLPCAGSGALSFCVQRDSQAFSTQANLFPSFQSLSIWLSVYSTARVQLSVPIIANTP